MGLDPRSRERLEQLGRQLPKPLPLPVEPPAPARHRLETETDPQALFRELMQASPDGRVPPHLLDRLRQLEAGKRPDSEAAQSGSGRKGQAGPVSRRRQAASDPDPLYVCFEQMLLEDDNL